ncbi:NAD(P)-dependent alcohol dehydrogenase [Sphingobium aromaticivastans]|uniref:zinc-dependent alcohol dehydrogenase family protein n=1 Tax=Sphingobium aromaticivastans TaxID=1778665 RepID=UPI0030172832
MKTWQIGERKGIESLALTQRPVPQPGPGQAVVRVRAAGLNNRDLRFVANTYGMGNPADRIPLSDGAGEVVAVGTGVTNVSIGDRVSATNMAYWTSGPFIGKAAFDADIGISLDGWLTEYALLPAVALFPIPDRLSFEDAAAMTVAGGTAWHILIELAQIEPGAVVLTQGTGGVSMFAVQIAKMAGARAAITSSSDQKLAIAADHGADILINYRRTPDWEAELLAATDGHGADVVVEVSGPAALERSLTATALNGHIGWIGSMSGSVEKAPNLFPLISRNIVLKGIASASRAMMMDWYKAAVANDLRPVIAARFAFSDAPAAFTALASEQHVGKIVITLD